jgi:hypothetical protein
LTGSEIVGVDDILPQALWTKYFLEAQGYGTNSVIYQDNQSTMKLEHNGRASSSKPTRHINICYFFIMDRVKQGDVTVGFNPSGTKSKLVEMKKSYASAVKDQNARLEIELAECKEIERDQTGNQESIY